VISICGASNGWTAGFSLIGTDPEECATVIDGYTQVEAQAEGWDRHGMWKITCEPFPYTSKLHDSGSKESLECKYF
jgi:hypothetical protein